MVGCRNRLRGGSGRCSTNWPAWCCLWRGFTIVRSIWAARYKKFLVKLTLASISVRRAVAMRLVWQYAEVSGNPRWKGLTWGMVSAWHTFDLPVTWSITPKHTRIWRAYMSSESPVASTSVARSSMYSRNKALIRYRAQLLAITRQLYFPGSPGGGAVRTFSLLTRWTNKEIVAAHGRD